jgi:hypothetical protein
MCAERLTIPCSRSRVPDPWRLTPSRLRQIVGSSAACHEPLTPKSDKGTGRACARTYRSSPRSAPDSAVSGHRLVQRCKLPSGASDGSTAHSCGCPLGRIGASERCFEQLRVALDARTQLIALDLNRSIGHELDLSVLARQGNGDHHGVGPGVAKRIEDVRLVQPVQEVKKSLEDPARTGTARVNISLFHRTILTARRVRFCRRPGMLACSPGANLDLSRS